MKKSLYVLLLLLVIVCFTGCNRKNKYIDCTPEEKENQSCDFNLNPVCGDNGETYGNACVACASNDINSYKIGECPICDETKGICSIGNIGENDINVDVNVSNQEVNVNIPTPNFE